MPKIYFVILSFTLMLLPAFGGCDISDLDRAEVVQALYKVSKPQGSGYLHNYRSPLSREEAEEALAYNGEIDYLKGRLMKIFLPAGAKTFDPWLFNRNNGPNAAEKAIDDLRTTKNS